MKQDVYESIVLEANNSREIDAYNHVKCMSDQIQMELVVLPIGLVSRSCGIVERETALIQDTSR